VAFATSATLLIRHREAWSRDPHLCTELDGGVQVVVVVVAVEPR